MISKAEAVRLMRLVLTTDPHITLGKTAELLRRYEAALGIEEGER